MLVRSGRLFTRRRLVRAVSIVRWRLTKRDRTAQKQDLVSELARLREGKLEDGARPQQWRGREPRAREDVRRGADHLETNDAARLNAHLARFIAPVRHAHVRHLGHRAANSSEVNS